jgi:LuxR family maltose regulon positive regulatory protein
VIPRPQLLGRLDELTRGPLTVVDAPTGYGKTTLLASWVASTFRKVAWASVGSRELDADGFWGVLTAAVEDAEPGLRLGSFVHLAPLDRAVELATALRSLDHELTVVIDGFEQAVRVGVGPIISRFLDLAPEQLHVIVSTRCEPELDMPLRRVRATVAELTARDLRLDPSETAAILQRTVGGITTDEDAAELSERVEGWPAGVYLAALSARGTSDPSAAITRFSGATREVSDYLRLELLDAQTDDVGRSFLLETSVLELLTPALCDQLLLRRDSDSRLRELARAGSFLVPFEGGGAYRYVRPVREFLGAELLRVAPGRSGDLRMRAAAACERAGLFDEAAAHARAEGGEEAAARVLARHAVELVRDGHREHLERILDTRAGAVAEQRRPSLRAELRSLGRETTDIPALTGISTRVAILSGGLADGPVRALLEATANATHAYALLLSGSVAEAYEMGAAAHAAADPDAAAPAAKAAAVASLAASRLGLGAAAAPLARAGRAALARRGIRSGRAAVLAALAEAAVAEKEGDAVRAERLSVAGAEAATDSALRALALLQLAHLGLADPATARATLESARLDLSVCHGAELLETLAGEVESALRRRERPQIATGELSPAERRVLRLLATSLTQREIASELFISPNTVKTHTRLIYRRLGVAARPDAVAAARELNLV